MATGVLFARLNMSADIELMNNNLELAKYEFKLPPLLEDEDIEEILGKIDELTSWASILRTMLFNQHFKERSGTVLS